MPRTPEVCPTVVCPLSHVSKIASRVANILPHAPRLQPSAFGHLRSNSSYRLSSAVLLLRCSFCLLVLVISCHCSLVGALAQGTTATLSGTVTDQNDAVIPDVSIAVINIAQGFQRSATTNGEGAFVVPLLPPGNYIVKAEHAGFTPTEVRDVVLNVNDQVAMKIHMSVGKISQSVEIVDGAALINESPTVGTVVDRQFVANLPLNGRSFQSLITLTPGSVLTKSTFTEQGQFSVNGQRADANYFLIDGVSANIGVSGDLNLGQSGAGSTPGLTAFGGTNNLVSVDALQEFKIQTSTYAPEFGRQPGAQVSIVTRSGTNSYRGTLFEYFRNEVFDANDWFANATRLAKPATRQNQFGGVFGGPLPFLNFGEGVPLFNSGKDRTFFFFSYEGLRLRLPQTASVDVPSLAARQVAPAGTRPILEAYPLPNGPNRIGANGQPNGFAVYKASFSTPSKLDATSVRVDHRIGSALTLFGRYNHAPSETIERGSSRVQTLNTLLHFASKTQTLTGGATWGITPATSNELRANYSRNTGTGFFELDDLGGAVVPPDSVLFPSGRSREDSTVSFSLLGAGSSILSTGKIAANLQEQVNIVDNLTIVTANHQLRFGIDYRRLSPVLSPRNYALLVQFRGVGTPGAPTQTAGSALSGLAGPTNISTQTGPQFPIFENLSLYGQDTWKVGQRLTLTYGLRWEVNPPPTEKNGKNPAVVAGLDNPRTATLAPAGTPLYQTTYGNFAPRIGAAYQISQQTGRELVVRGGFGVFYDLGYGPAADAFARSFPFSTLRSVSSNVPFPLSPANAAPAVVGTLPTNQAFVAFDPHIKLPRTYQWNVAVEQTLGANQTFSASYLAALGRKLLRQELLQGSAALNPAVFTPTGRLFTTRNTATSDYHALQLQFQRRMSHGLQALASYTWAKSLDIASNDSSTLNTPAANINPQLDRGPSDFDVRHAFTGALTYNLPKASGTIARAITRDWSIDTIVTARTATPVNVFYQTVTSFGTAIFRPDLVSGVPLYVNDPTVGGGRRLNRAAFFIPADPLTGVASRQGTLGRNSLRGFSVWQVDFAVRRQFNFSERHNLQLKAEFFNVVNHPNFADPDGILDSFSGLLPNPAFGISPSMLGRSLGTGGASGGFNPLYQIGGPRSIQLSLKLNF